jgi:hypothetical protein
MTDEKHKNFWECPYCTFHNDLLQIACTICFTRRTKLEHCEHTSLSNCRECELLQIVCATCKKKSTREAKLVQNPSPATESLSESLPESLPESLSFYRDDREDQTPNTHHSIGVRVDLFVNDLFVGKMECTVDSQTPVEVFRSMMEWVFGLIPPYRILDGQMSLFMNEKSQNVSVGELWQQEKIHLIVQGCAFLCPTCRKILMNRICKTCQKCPIEFPSVTYDQVRREAFKKYHHFIEDLKQIGVL